MGLFDKAKKISNRAMDTVKDLDKEVNNQVQKRNKEKELKKQKKREKKVKKRLAEEKEKRLNPKINVNGLPGAVLISDEKIIITAIGKRYDVFYNDITDISQKGTSLTIKTRNNEFKVMARTIGYMFIVAEYYHQIVENKQKYLTKNNSTDQQKSSDTEELEKIMTMYEKGLLTDEEFATMKKKIIEK